MTSTLYKQAYFDGVIPSPILLEIPFSSMYLSPDGIILGVCWKGPEMPDSELIDTTPVGMHVVDTCKRKENGHKLMEAIHLARKTRESQVYWFETETVNSPDSTELFRGTVLPGDLRGSYAIFEHLPDIYQFEKLIWEFEDKVNRLNEDEKAVLRDLWDGISVEDSAKSLSISERSVYRLRNSVKKQINYDVMEWVSANVQKMLARLVRNS